MAITGDSSPRVGQAQDYAEAGWTVEQMAGFGRLRSLHNPTLCV